MQILHLAQSLANKYQAQELLIIIIIIVRNEISTLEYYTITTITEKRKPPNRLNFHTPQ